ncbi:FliI/YscN family ATPase [Ramlibacter cellulosilyticus]|nr:FliI/YscN family ATPase [Ramlibacter cellulosilyticus]
MAAYRRQLAASELTRRMGWVRRVQGLAIEAEGPEVELGSMCHVHPASAAGSPVLAEVVGIEARRVVLMPFGALQGIAAGSHVLAVEAAAEIAVGPDILGRVVDAFGAPLDGHAPPACNGTWPLAGRTPSPMQRPRIRRVLETGVRAIDALLTLGEGQRAGIFAGSGVGKSSLLGMVTRHARVDVNVIAMIGERGREVREFVEEQLGTEGLRRSVVVAATADQPALCRIRAAHVALAIAEWFRDQGRSVLLTMDSVTRLAMARREVGLAAGEPATARGYTPSVFAELPRLCERCGTAPSGGSITALMAVLVEGDDFNEPIADAMRAVLDGHVVLSRSLAQQGHFPAIDILQSASRVMGDLAGEEERSLAASAVRHLAALERGRPLVELGAYAGGSNPALDAALAVEGKLFAWLRQDAGGCSRADALRQLRDALQTRGAA